MFIKKICVFPYKNRKRSILYLYLRILVNAYNICTTSNHFHFKSINAWLVHFRTLQLQTENYSTQIWFKINTHLLTVSLHFFISRKRNRESSTMIKYTYKCWILHLYLIKQLNLALPLHLIKLAKTKWHGACMKRNILFHVLSSSVPCDIQNNIMFRINW